MPRKDPYLSSRQLLDRIGLGDDRPLDLLGDEPLDDLRGDVGAALLARYRSFTQPHRFQPGDLVTWKPGLKNRRVPRAGAPAVVLAVLDQPLYDSEHDSGHTYFHEPLDLVLGLFMDEGDARGDFLAWHYDRRRFQPWTREDRP